MRTRILLVGAGFAALAVLALVLFTDPRRRELGEARRRTEAARQERTQLQARLEALRALERRAPQLRAELARLDDALPNDPRLPDLILLIQEAASLAGIDFLSITPSLPSPFTPPGGAGAAPPGGAAAPPPGRQLQAISVSIQCTGKFFEIEDFIVRLERLRRGVRINTVSLAPGGGGPAASPQPGPGASPVLNASFQLQVFLQAPAAPPSPTPSPGPGPSPGASPSPAPSPTPSPAATPGGG